MICKSVVMAEKQCYIKYTRLPSFHRKNSSITLMKGSGNLSSEILRESFFYCIVGAAVVQG